MMKSDRQALPDMSSSNSPYTPTQTRQTNAKRPLIDSTKLRLEPKITGFRIQFALTILNCRVDSGSPYFFQHLIVVLGGSRFGPTPLPNPPYGSGYPGEWMLNGSWMDFSTPKKHAKGRFWSPYLTGMGHPLPQTRLDCPGILPEKAFLGRLRKSIQESTRFSKRVFNIGGKGISMIWRFDEPWMYLNSLGRHGMCQKLKTHNRTYRLSLAILEWNHPNHAVTVPV